MSIESALTGILRVRTNVPEQAVTASTLGSEREGNGIILSEQGLVLTIGYVVTEAESIWLIDSEQNAVEGHLLGYDQRSGFGLVQALGRLQGSALELGDSEQVDVGREMYLAGAGGANASIPVTVSEIREFAGYWEYMIDGAIFTEPAHPNWGGTALLDDDGRVFGMGSLVLQSKKGEEQARNMVIPINLYREISEEMMSHGGRADAPRPWIGWYIQDSAKGPMVIGLVDDAPGMQAGVKPGDLVVAINGRRVASLSQIYTEIWGAGEAGIAVDVAIKRDSELQIVQVASIDRASMLWRSALH